MRILQMSDLHLEFDHYRPTEDADILMLNGDICVADYLSRGPGSPYEHSAKSFRDFFEYCTDKYAYVLYIPGNHEYYQGRYQNAVSNLVDVNPYIHLLNDSCIDIEGIRFIGATLWTNNHKGCPITEMVVKDSLNDYRLITYYDGTHYRKLNPSDTYAMHVESVRMIDLYSANHDNVVVMSHHAPSAQSIHDKYAADYYVNGAYYSEMDYFIMDRPQIKLWTHGHMHNSFDYTIGTTRVVCNPKGYKNENPHFNYKNILEIA